MKRNQIMTSGSNEVALFPMEYLQVTQGRYSNPTHVGYNATDLAGKDRGIDQVFAPFTLKVRWKDPNTHTGVVLSNEKHVLMANGKVQAPNTILMMLWHDNYIGDLHVGQVIPQGQKFYDEGTKGYATGNHVHLELSYGTYNGYPLYQLSNGYWTLKGTELNIEDCFHINDTKIVNNGGYKFKTFTQPKPSKPNLNNKWVGLDITTVAQQVIRGDWYNGDARTKSLKKYGYDPVAVQNEVNRILYGKPKPSKTAKQVAWDILNTNHKWGNGNTRKQRLEKAGYNYNEVQNHINKMLG